GGELDPKFVLKSVAFSPDGRLALSGGGQDKTVKVWEIFGK
ncbi:MAG: hypothetical protein IIC13_19335, partial [SAR324 cluster bacterium]|nr:hypothetical protein [SAR324 cluster bacterium]